MGSEKLICLNMIIVDVGFEPLKKLCYKICALPQPEFAFINRDWAVISVVVFELWPNFV